MQGQVATAAAASVASVDAPQEMVSGTEEEEEREKKEVEYFKCIESGQFAIKCPNIEGKAPT